jgi:hypothetical protein
MRTTKIIRGFLLFVCAGIYGYSTVNIKSGQAFNITVDLANPLSIVWPFEVAIIGTQGQKGLRIGPKIGRGWRGEAGGDATYRFYIPQNGKYRIWAYCLWFDECANAVFAQIDNLEKAILGNDPIYNQWHWTRGFDVELEKGTHTLVLSNHSDHISLQKVLLTNSHSFTPDSHGPVFSDVFYDGFDGCDQGNFARWKIISGEWTVQNPDANVCLTENALIGKSKDNSFIIYENNEWAGYLLNVAVKSSISESPNSSVAICFGIKDPNQYHQLQLRPSGNIDKVEMEIIRKTADRQDVLAHFISPWKSGLWHHIEIGLNTNAIVVKVDETKSIKIPINYRINGGIGLSLKGQITALFDDIHVRQSTGK